MENCCFVFFFLLSSATAHIVPVEGLLQEELLMLIKGNVPVSSDNSLGVGRKSSQRLLCLKMFLCKYSVNLINVVGEI